MSKGEHRDRSTTSRGTANTGVSPDSRATTETSPQSRYATPKGIASTPEQLSIRVRRFSPHVNPDLNIHDALQQQKRIAIRGEFTVSAVVEVRGGSDTEAQHWEVGFTQTILKSNRWGHYFDKRNQPLYLYKNECKPLPAFDGEGRLAPWYTFPGRLQKTNTQVEVDTFDWPTAGAPYWTQNGQGELKYYSGVDEFLTVLIAKHSETRQIRFLSWAWWQVQYASEIDATNYSGEPKGGQALLLGKGTGGSSISPELKRPSKWIDVWYSVAGGKHVALSSPP